MINYNSPKYDSCREWIRKCRSKGKSWDFIDKEDKELDSFLERKREEDFWEVENKEVYRVIVASEKKAEREAENAEYVDGKSSVISEGQENDVDIPRDKKSMWQLYKNYLIDEKDFKEDTINEMEMITLKTLKKLDGDTSITEPVKGLVIGNVQSGKTSNMAALMAMAADWGWNMFIVLSGTIENLREQTQKRILEDLNRGGGNCSWIGLEHLSLSSPYGQKLQDLHFEDNSRERYFTVCLKNSTRLKNLLQWIVKDKHKRQQMKILVIDDEADQASVNTADVNDINKERKAINRHLVNLVAGRDEKGRHVEGSYKAMNYIGYTATPYANVLNEDLEESLFPKNFIAVLPLSKEYFGPQQIFGVEGDDYDGIDIVRIVENEDLKVLQDIHDGYLNNIPKSLENAICWFLCGAATMRVQGYKKPISMLVHTSQKQDHHEYLSKVIENFFKKDRDIIIEYCKKIWKKETERFTKKHFREQYKDYAIEDKYIKDYPKFEEIEDEIKILLSTISNIKLGEDGELQFNEGIHLCVDNCNNSGVNSEGMFLRLAYPDKNTKLEKAPAFIVIGGATLSRGLTIEGLISTFFLRSVKQADTLMQMGRWFGYRKNYELIPRIWITLNTNAQFRFLSTLDMELRREIQQMDATGSTPRDYKPRVKNTPKYSFIRITAKNKSQNAIETEMDFSGSFNQTVLFENDKEVLKHNICITEEFISLLGNPLPSQEHNKNCAVWKNISFKNIKSMFLEKFIFSSRAKAFNDIESLCKWIEEATQKEMLDDWNIIVAGKKGKGPKWDVNGISITKVQRSQKKRLSEHEQGLIDIGALRSSKDFLADIDINKVSEDLKQRIVKFNSKDAKAIRSEAGLDSKPQLIIYRIDKNSKAKSEAENREDLNAVEDIIGICINIPGNKKGHGYATAIRLKTSFMESLDLEEE